jgi:hypothetical protein
MRLGRKLGVLVLGLVACGPKESPEERITRLRLAHEVQPTAVQVRQTPEGPQLVLDFLVVNKGREVLPTLTVKVIIVAANGQDRATHLVSLDTAQLRPGVASQLTALLRGETLQPGEQVRVEVEGRVSPESRAHYPEFGGRP